VAATVSGRRCAVANLGDSRAYLIRGGAARQVTEDHSGKMAHSITRFVGDPRGVAPDVFTESLQARDRLVLCSDGLTRHVHAEEIAQAAGATAPARAASALVDMANARGGEDNVTVLIYRDSPFPRSVLVAALTIIVALAAIGVAAVALAPSISAPSSTPAPVASPTPSPTPTDSPAPTATPTPSPSPTPTSSPSPTP